MLEVICEGAEHHFVTMLGNLENDSTGWGFLYFGFLQEKLHDKVLNRGGDFSSLVQEHQKIAESYIQTMREYLDGVDKSYIYRFKDGDVGVLVKSGDQKQSGVVTKLYQNLVIRHNADQGVSKIYQVSDSLYNLKNLAAKKLLSSKCMDAYTLMENQNVVSSLSARRDIREDAKILMVEDDRFTASYAAKILGREYDMIVARSGEDGILAYIEEAPDVVFIDIHLPGISGIQTLQAIKKIDPKAFAVMLSADTKRGNIVQSASGGAKNFLKKPFSRDRLTSIVKQSPFLALTKQQDYLERI